MRPHDEPCFLLVRILGHVELERSFPLLVPATAVKVVQLGSRRGEDGPLARFAGLD